MRAGDALSIWGAAWYDLMLAATMRNADVGIIVTENVTDFQRFSFISALRIRDPSLRA